MLLPHKAAVQFWWMALALAGDGALTEDRRSFAESEVARHQTALALTPTVNRYGPPPDFFGQPV